jgi:hypothetical protein
MTSRNALHPFRYLSGAGVAVGFQTHITRSRGLVDAPEGDMTDEDWAELEPTERAFAVRWLGLDEHEREAFCRQLLAAIEVLERFRVFDGGEPETASV